ncbi:MAG: hypothetical protein AAF533_22475 [Acidobacteriota bacterium]
MTDHERPDSPFGKLRPPGPPDELEARVLAAAQLALAQPRPDPWERTWRSSWFRLSWAAVFLALVVGHLAVPDGPPLPASTPTVARRETASIPEIALVFVPVDLTVASVR